MVLKYRRVFSSIRAKLLFWFVAIAVVPLAASSIYGYVRSREMILDSTLKYLRHVAPDMRLHLSEQAVKAKGKNLDLRDAWEGMEEKDLRLKNEQVFLINGEGRMFPFTPTPSADREKQGFVYRSEGFLQCMEQKKEVTGSFVDYKGNKVLAVYVWLGEGDPLRHARLPDDSSPRVLVTEVAQAEALRPLLSLRNNALVFSGILFVFISVAGLLVARGIANPILHFVRATERIREGDLSERVQVRSRDEIGTLAREFNRMVERLEDLYAHLEEKVEERTRQLANAQDQLVRSEKLAAVGSLAASIAHEVRNPLAGISGAMQVIGESFPEGDSRRDVVKEVREQINRLNQIVSDLLVFAKPNPPRRVDCNLRELLEETVERLRAGPTLERMEVRIDSPDPPDRLPPARIDPAQMEEVFVNLMINAADAVPAEGGRLDVSVGMEPGRLTVRFQDNGPGIDTESAASIFDPFFTTKHRGTGLGLSITRKIVEAHGGSVVAIRRDSSGACFLIRLPLGNEEGEEK